ncbi:glycosyltransferase family 4 protein [Aureibacillus halotolerans]|uniref:Glycosyltransferase involved in cell wall biosynthesis n=1 Tax=Aureibacillus halotolerans TaxID=1508390 RepID=A0A4V3D545_9BACI|nr:glycosyltransferase family 4 protein [Aureibacillus halotolerans]TDQ38677.1 glycosyltransferase involved in cell wall biosynthesis [Aureibacillus halotolerans]
MNILYIHQYFTTRDGATGTRSYEFAKHLVAQGHSVTVITGDAHLKAYMPASDERVARFTMDGIEVVAIRNAYSNYMSTTARIKSFLSFMAKASRLSLQDKNIDVVLATSTPLTVAIPALLRRMWRKTPFVFEVRDLWPEAPIQMGIIRSPIVKKVLKTVEQHTYRKAEHVIALSPGMAKGVTDEGIATEKVTMIPNCSDLSLFDPSKAAAPELQAKYGLEGKFVVVHGGSMGIANGLQCVVEAAAALKRRQDDSVAFLLTGDGKTKPELEEACRREGLDNIHFTGSVPRKDMPDILALADLTLTSFQKVPILATNSPNKFFDAMAAGKPILVNSNGWTRQIVEGCKIGEYVDPDEPEAFADTLQRLKQDPEWLEEMGKRARAVAENDYDRQKLALHVERVLTNAVRPASAHRLKEAQARKF